VPIPHPRNVGEILDGSFRLTFRRFWLFASLALIPNIALAADTFGAAWLASAVTGVRLERIAAPRPDQGQAAYFEWLAVWLGTLLVSIIPLTWIYGAFLGALESAIASEAVGERASFRGAFRVGLRRPWSVATLEFIQMMGLSCLCVPGCIFVGYFWPAVPVIVLEGSSWTDALGRTGELTRGYRWRCFGIWLLLFVLPQFVLGPLVWPKSFEELLARRFEISEWVQNLFTVLYVVGFLLSQIAHVFARAAQVLLYLDLRVRKEGLDLVPVPSVR
jgi:hypothetical protein